MSSNFVVRVTIICTSCDIMRFRNYQQLVYRLVDGRRGTMALNVFQKSKEGASYVARGGFLDSVDTSGEFWIHANDLRQGPFRFRVVDRLLTEKIEVKCSYPEYLVNSSPIWSGEVLPFVNGGNYPEKTGCLLRVRFNRKGLNAAKAWDQETGELLERGDDQLAEGELWVKTVINKNRVIFVAAEDSQGVVSPEAARLEFRMVPDNPPKVNVTPQGIGFYVTKNAVIRLEIEGQDEFGIRGGQLRVRLESGPPLDSGTEGRAIPAGQGEANTQEQPREIQTGSESFDWKVEREREIEFDLLEWRRRGKLVLDSEDEDVQSRLTLQTSLFDYCPSHSPTVGQEYEFLVVGEKRFLQLLEREEADLRKRLESIYDEMETAREICRLLVRLSLPERKQPEPGQQAENSVSRLSAGSKADAVVAVQRILLQVQKSKREILSVVQAFQMLIENLENNRLQVPRKQKDLEKRVAVPLLEFASRELANYQVRLETLRSDLNGPGAVGEPDLQPRAKMIMLEHERLLVQLDAVIRRLVKFESQSELLDSLRNLIDQQKKILEATRKERNRKLFEGLLD